MIVQIGDMRSGIESCDRLAINIMNIYLEDSFGDAI